MARWAARWLLAFAGLCMLTSYLPSQTATFPVRQYKERTWQTQDGLPDNTVRSVLQARDGYLWLGTDEGLVRYNGVDFVLFNRANTPEIGSDVIENLQQDRTGVLWISTSSGLTAFSGDRFQVVRGMTSPGSGPVWVTHEGKEGQVWAASSSGICVVKDLYCRPVAGINYRDVTSGKLIADGADGSLWVGGGREFSRLNVAGDATARHVSTVGGEDISVLLSCADGLLIGTGGGLQLYRNGDLSRVRLEAHGPEMEVTSLLADGGGGAWVGTPAGLAHYTGGKITMVPALPTALSIRQLFKGRQGELWLVLDRGVYRFADGRFEPLPADDVVMGATVLQMMQDREGSLWFGTDSEGLAMLHRQKLLTYTTRDGLSGNVIKSIVQDFRSKVWIGTEGEGLDQFSGGGFSSMSAAKRLTSDSVLSLATDSRGTIWAGTPAGLNAIRGGRIQQFTSKQGLADDFVRSLLVTSDGTVWAGTTHGLSHFSKGQFTTFTRMDGLGGDFIGAMLQRRSGELWVSTSGGVSRLDHGRFTTLTTNDGLASNIVTAMQEDDDGTVWLASSGGIISRFHEGTLQTLTSPQLPQTIYSLLADDLGHLWLGSRSGIFRIDRSDLDQAMHDHSLLHSVKAYDVSDGMDVRECSGGGHPAAWRLKDGSLWFATMHGVSVVDPARVEDDRFTPQISIESVLVDDARHSASESLVFGPGFHRVQFQFAGLLYAAPQKVRYQYQLEGFDKRWMDGANRRTAFYNNLPPGKYVFRVRAVEEAGQWSEPATSGTLQIKPHIYETLWFYLLALLAIAGTVFTVYRWRVRQVAAVYEGVMSERTRIAREIHDTLAQSIVSISVKLEVVSRLMRSGQTLDAARGYLDETRVLVRQSLDEARSSIWDLRMQSEGIKDLPKQIGSGLNRLIAQTSISGSIKVHGSYRELARETEQELGKIAQEAITNAVRHSGCTSIEVILEYGIDRLVLSVVDDGRGMGEEAKTAADRGRFGVRGMQERAERIGARLMIEQREPRGTRIRLELPLT